MRLRNSQLSVDQKIWEFDLWVTPSIVDIRTTERFRDEMGKITSTLAVLSNEVPPLQEHRLSARIVDRTFLTLHENLRDLDRSERKDGSLEVLMALSSLLFLVTGKSDNNHKCQFPLFLKNELGWKTLPAFRISQGTAVRLNDDIPRVLDSDKYMSRIASIFVCSLQLQGQDRTTVLDQAKLLLHAYGSCLLADTPSRNQLLEFIAYHARCTADRRDPSLMLVPLVTFQVRGSVTATGGHEPEVRLRARMMEWGMVDDIDFNTSDVVLDVERGRLAESDAELTPAAALRNKTRAYDFVLPFRTPTWQPHIFIQSQFYAGDSGSVSHKNVDQTQASRRNATSTCERARWPLPRFIEYVDGAGYSASLNRDLRSLLNFPDTADFFQIRSAPVRLRRQLQDIGFLTPMEIAHALIRRRNVMSAAIALLVEEGYQPVEIERSRLIAAENGYIRQVDGDDWAVPEDRIQIVRQYLVLDLVATNGREHENAGDPRGMVLIPGFGPYFGILLTVLAGIAAAGFPVLWPGQLLLSDLGELAGKGFVLLR